MIAFIGPDISEVELIIEFKVTHQFTLIATWTNKEYFASASLAPALRLLSTTAAPSYVGKSMLLKLKLNTQYMNSPSLLVFKRLAGTYGCWYDFVYEQMYAMQLDTEY